MYYGGTDPEKQKRRYVKHYNHDGTFEIKHDRTTGQTQFYIYLGGHGFWGGVGRGFAAFGEEQ